TLRSPSAEELAGTDLVVTSYGTFLRLGWLGKTPWPLAVVDEAQAIKNPDARQTRAVKALDAESPHRHAGREQSSRPVVDLRFSQSGAARLVEGLRRLRQEPRRPHAAVLCATAQARRP